MLTVKRASANCSKNTTAGENSLIEINAQTGELESPGYPEFFTGDIKCTWYIYVARTYSIELEFIFFDFGNSQPCSTTEGTSYLEVRDGVHRDSQQLGLFCGHARPEKISTIGSQMRVSFTASRYRSLKFKATYRAVRGEHYWYYVTWWAHATIYRLPVQALFYMCEPEYDVVAKFRSVEFLTLEFMSGSNIFIYHIHEYFALNLVFERLTFRILLNVRSSEILCISTLRIL